MKKIAIFSIAMMSAISVTTSANAGEEYQHFPSVASPNTTAALCNLASFNEKLAQITHKQTLTPEDMVKVHELTYTLENAVIRLQKDLNAIAEDLEEVHKASERLEQSTIKDSGKAYLKALDVILSAESLRKSCK